MWWWFLLWILVIFVLLSAGNWYGYRRSYYGAGGVVGLWAVLFILFWLAILSPGRGGVGTAGGGRTVAGVAKHS